MNAPYSVQRSRILEVITKYTKPGIVILIKGTVLAGEIPKEYAFDPQEEIDLSEYILIILTDAVKDKNKLSYFVENNEDKLDDLFLLTNSFGNFNSYAGRGDTFSKRIFDYGLKLYDSGTNGIPDILVETTLTQQRENAREISFSSKIIDDFFRSIKAYEYTEKDDLWKEKRLSEIGELSGNKQLGQYLALCFHYYQVFYGCLYNFIVCATNYRPAYETINRLFDLAAALNSDIKLIKKEDSLLPAIETMVKAKSLVDHPYEMDKRFKNKEITRLEVEDVINVCTMVHQITWPKIQGFINNYHTEYEGLKNAVNAAD